ncbi:hypothetical protein A3F55_01975 [Candidatus Adlerbacteria bacterium RIFCSPHIGHO2_12_FULL_53_18]|uniref:Putative 3-methyladenine DNA glycosylase n=1 Tax=Candidatus Adlerbacteria bacterium RIFCSPHIGHO2_12_FULL_53_18 TaxID=1797242 RepID=A0A1F4XSB2_9BACT|nr:MAG: hypothetical protein A3F55_01975 [Candidatus Adlerbacteria bacterium RIFCSPHIGHO2_12_FULL_53_18]
MARMLGPAFFDRPTLTVAKDLLGKFLVRRVRGKTVALMIVETEAYDGFKDLASHAHRGQTPRNTPMFGKPGTIYVYFTYGMHWMLNLVCGKKEYPAAVLIRGVSSSAKVSRSGEINGTPARDTFASLDGPAKLTKFLKIDKSLNHQPLGKKSGLWVEDRGEVISPRKIVRTPRIGINYAGEYIVKPWRFVLKNKCAPSGDPGRRTKIRSRLARH